MPMSAPVNPPRGRPNRGPSKRRQNRSRCNEWSEPWDRQRADSSHPAQRSAKEQPRPRPGGGTLGGFCVSFHDNFAIRPFLGHDERDLGFHEARGTEVIQDRHRFLAIVRDSKNGLGVFDMSSHCDSPRRVC